jgi:putative FmdB family regulatory protein
MPLYEYQCEACGQRFEVIQKFSDPPPDACRKCGKGPVQRLLSSPAIQFKGTGWYITDYAQKGKSGDSSGGQAGKSESSTSSDSTTKSESSTPAAAPSTTTTTKSDT